MNTFSSLEKQEASHTGHKKKGGRKERKKYLESRFVLPCINGGYCSAETLGRRLTVWEPNTQASGFSSSPTVAVSRQLCAFLTSGCLSQKNPLQICSGRQFLFMRAAKGMERPGGLGEPTYKGKGKNIWPLPCFQSYNGSKQ